MNVTLQISNEPVPNLNDSPTNGNLYIFVNLSNILNEFKEEKKV